MPADRGRRRRRRASPPRSSAEGGQALFPLVRHAHIFSSVVREVLELKLLRQASPLPLTLSQFHLLKLMTFNGQHQVGEVADFLGVSPPAATKNIDKLEGLGLVVRTPSQGDRRATLLSVSATGREIVADYEALKAQRLASVLGAFEPRELEQLSALLQRFSVSLLELEPQGQDTCLRCAAYIQVGCPVERVRGGCPYRSLRRPPEPAPEPRARTAARKVPGKRLAIARTPRSTKPR